MTIYITGPVFQHDVCSTSCNHEVGHCADASGDCNGEELIACHHGRVREIVGLEHGDNRILAYFQHLPGSTCLASADQHDVNPEMASDRRIVTLYGNRTRFFDDEGYPLPVVAVVAGDGHDDALDVYLYAAQSWAAAEAKAAELLGV